MIRDANESDLPRLAEAMVRLQEAHVGAFPDVYRRFGLSAAHSHLSGLLSQPDAIIRVVEREGTLVGHTVFLIETKPETMFTYSERVGHLAQMEIEPEFRREGYGRSLIVDCQKISVTRNLSRIVLDVWAFNGSAKSFFRASGFDDFGSKMSMPVG